MAPCIRSNLGYSLLKEAVFVECVYDLHVGMHRACGTCTDSTFQCDLHYNNSDSGTAELRVVSESQ
jgi:hypothetical protein